MEIVSTDTILPGADIDLLNNILGTAADIILVLGKDGMIKEARRQGESDLIFNSDEWEGKNIRDLVSIGCKEKIDSLLKLPSDSQSTRALQISHPGTEDTDAPVSYRATKLNARGDLILFGQCEIKLTAMQNRLFEAQITLDREISKLRRKQDIYKNIFKSSKIPQVIVEVDTLQVVDLNAEAKRAIGPEKAKSKRPLIFDLFPADDNSILHKALLSSAENSLDPVQINLKDGSTAQLSASSHYMDGKNHVLLEILCEGEVHSPQEFPHAIGNISDIIEVMPDAYVVLDEMQKVVAANSLFYRLFAIQDDYDLTSLSFETLWDEPRVHAEALFSKLHNKGMAKVEAVIVKNLHNDKITVDISGHKFVSDQDVCLGLSFRKNVGDDHASFSLGQDRTLPDQWVESLVNTMSLKEIVRQTTDSIEQLCIDRALKLTENNRASTAKLLGISRQSLYLKMKSYSKN